MKDTAELSPREQIRKWNDDRKKRRERFFPRPQPLPVAALEKPQAPEPEVPAAFNAQACLVPEAGGAPGEHDTECALQQTLPSRHVTVEDIQRVVAKDYNVSRDDLTGTKRIHTVTVPRQLAMLLATRLTKRSMPDIGRRFGGRDHTTVLHAKAIVSWRIGDRDKAYKCLRGRDPSEKIDAELAERVTRLQKLIEEKWPAQ